MAFTRTTAVLVTVAGVHDPAFAAKLHLEALPDSFFATLGQRFLRSYYRMYLLSPYAVFLVARQGPAPVGILAATTDDLSHYRWATRSYGWRLALAVVRALAVRPRVLVRFLRTRFGRYVRAVLRLRRTTATPETARPILEENGRTGSLSHLAVVPEARDAGIGRTLVSAYQHLAAAVGAERLNTTTRGNAAGASGFYQRLGWRSAGAVTDLDGRAFERFQLDL